MKNEKEYRESDQSEEYVEIMGDTVSPNNVIFSILISVVLGLGGYLAGKQFFPTIADETMVKSYSLLLGILGCVIALVLNAFLFRPKRVLTESQPDTADSKKLLKDLQVDLDEEYEVVNNDPVTRKEMEELKILDTFKPEEREK
ncbi:hypothetical protein [Virgibacillus siamensis]|uniref:hypothetical protein n=1 Tax=Virgibacillus siamensis TaxID=480071 RepID=UPI000987A807|nr:hypothetical protein [Virgibacillus siamensis]